jgi:hypothetical protein
MKKLLAWCGKRWRMILTAALFLLGLFVGITATRRIMQARRGAVRQNEWRGWVAIDEKVLAVRDGKTWVQVRVPAGVAVRDVKAVGIARGKAVVEVRHERKRRRA